MELRKKILIIEDHAELRENTAEILSLAHYDVFTATNGKTGVEMAQEHMPDLIVCDIMMPVLDGYGVLHLLSKDSRTAGIPFIFLTAKAERTDFRKGMEMGADDYLTKPFDDTELLLAIEVRLKKAAAGPPRNEEKRLPDSGSELLKQVSARYEVCFYKKKELIYTEGNFPRAVYYVEKGKVKIHRANASGKELITTIHGAGDFFGYTAILEHTAYPDSATALEDSEIYRVEKDDFFSLLHKNASVSGRFIQLLAGNLQDREKQLIQLAYNSVRKKVAEALLTLCKKYANNESTEIVFQISREDLANLAGTATETTIRTLSDFKDEGLLDIAGGNLIIRNTEKLAQLKN